MFSIVKIDNGIFLDGKKLNCVRAYELKQAEGEDIAELAVKMDVLVFDGIIKTPGIVAGSIKAEKLSGLRLSDLVNLISDDALVKVADQKGMGTAVNVYEPGSISGEDPNFLEKHVKTIRTNINALVIELED